MLQTGNAYSVGLFGWIEQDLSLPDIGNVATFGWQSYDLHDTFPYYSGLTEDPSFEYLYVHPNASGKNNGLSWYDAFTTITEALEVLKSGAIFIKFIDLETFGGTGIIMSSGVINKIAIANKSYNEDLTMHYHDDDYSITLEGGFDPGWPLTSGYQKLIPSGYSYLHNINTGIYLHHLLSDHFIKNIQFDSGNYGIYVDTSRIYLSNVIISGVPNPIYFNDANYEFNNTNIYSGNIGCNLIISTGNIFNSMISGCNYGLSITSGNIANYSYNILKNNGTGIYTSKNSTITFTENLFENNYKAFYVKGNYYGNYNTIYGNAGITADYATGYYNNSIIYSSGTNYTIENISGQMLINNGCLYTPNYNSGNIYNIGSLLLSGDILYDDPNFTQLESGDYRLNITSRCLNKAEIIRDDVYTHYPIDINSIKIYDDYGLKSFNSYKDNIKIIDNAIVYINPLSGYTDIKVKVISNEKKTFEGEIEGISSFNLESGQIDKYPYDYKILSKYDYKKNIDEYYLLPYTIFEIRNVLGQYVTDPDLILKRLTKDNITVQTQYNFSNIVYDNQHGYDSLTNELYYTLEKNNQYLIKSDMIKGFELDRYYLMRPEPSGTIYKSIVYPSGLSKHGEVSNGFEFLTNNFQDTNKVIKDKYITCLNKEGAIKWLPIDMDKGPNSGNIYRDIRGLIVYDSNLYYLVTENYDDVFKYNRHLREGNKTYLVKIDPDNEVDIEKIWSGQIVDIPNPASMTVNKDNKLMIVSYDSDSSGNYFMKEYRFCYDYALVDKNNDNTNRIFFREYYPLGVNV